MKREAAAAGLLFLLVLGAIWNVHVADELIEQVEHSLHRAEQAARLEDYEAARSALSGAKKVWDRHSTYTQIFFRHPDLDAIADAFAGFDQALLQRDPGWSAMLRLLREHLQTVNAMEHVSIGTVF